MYLFNVDKFFRCIDFIPNKGKDINSPYFEIKGIPGIKQTKLYIYIVYSRDDKANVEIHKILVTTIHIASNYSRVDNSADALKVSFTSSQRFGTDMAY